MLPWHSSGSWVSWALASLDSLAGACNKFCTCLHHNPASLDCHYWRRCQAIAHIWFGNTKFPHPRKVKKICSPRNSFEDVYSSFGSSPQKTRNNPIPFNGWTDRLWCVHVMQQFSAVKRNELSRRNHTDDAWKCYALHLAYYGRG